MVAHGDSMIRISVDYVALIADLMNKRNEIVDLINKLITRSSELREIFQGIGMIVIVNGLSSKSDTVLNDGGRVILLPPASGG